MMRPRWFTSRKSSMIEGNFWHILAHFSGFNMPRFTSVVFAAKQEIASVYAVLRDI